jgi:hypothetical protein
MVINLNYKTPKTTHVKQAIFRVSKNRKNNLVSSQLLRKKYIKSSKDKERIV